MDLSDLQAVYARKMERHNRFWETIARDGYFLEHWAYLALTKTFPQLPRDPVGYRGALDVLQFLEQANVYAQDQYAREAQQLGYVTGMHTMPSKKKPTAKKLNTEQGATPMPDETQEPKAEVPKKLVYVLKFHTRDGEEHQPGDSYEVPEDAIENLKAQGMVSEEPPKPPEEPQAV